MYRIYCGCVLSAIILSLAIAFPEDLGFLSFFFLLPILTLVSVEDKSTFELWRQMLIFSLLYNGISSIWILSAVPLYDIGIFSKLVIPLFSYVIFTFFSAIPISFWLIIFKVSSPHGVSGAIYGSAMWVLLEYIKTWFSALSFMGTQTLIGPHYTYYSIAYTATYLPFLKSLFPIGGIYLVDFALILINFLLFFTFELIVSRRKIHLRGALYLAAYLVIVIIFANQYFVKSTNSSQLKTDTVSVRLFNTNLRAEHSRSKEDERQYKIVDYLSQHVITDSIVAFPENISPLKWRNQFSSKAKNIITEPLYIGSFSDQRHFVTFFYNGVKDDIVTFPKRLLMPIGEYQVYWVELLLSLLNIKTDPYTEVSGYGSYVYVSKDNLLVSGVLCSENISPELFRSGTRQGANILYNLISRSSFDDFGHMMERQTNSIVVARALENGRYIIAPANRQSSFIVSDAGIITSKLSSQDQVSSISAQILKRQYMTLYVKYGDYTVLLSLVMVATLLIRMNKRENQEDYQ